MGGVGERRGDGSGARDAVVRRLRELDWDFATEQSESPFSNLHWHPCRFPSQLAAILIGRLTNVGETVLDPFMGSGTTLVESQRLGRRAYGIDVNPVACLIARSKVYSDEGEEVALHIEDVIREVSICWDKLATSAVPEDVQSEKWYGERTLSELMKLWTIVSREEARFSDVTKAAFSAILLKCCRETRHWGYVCDNTEPKASREVNARREFVSLLRRFQNAYRRRAEGKDRPRFVAEVVQGNSADVLQAMEERTVSCIVTSPPYQGVADYVKAQRLSMEWFGWNIEPYRQTEIGARSKRRRHLAITQFLDDLHSVFEQAHRVLVKDGVAAVVYGASPARPNTIGEFLGGLERIGFRVEARLSRNISNARRQAPSLSQEEVIVLRKGRDE